MWVVERTEDERRKIIDVRRETYCKLGDVEEECGGCKAKNKVK